MSFGSPKKRTTLKKRLFIAIKKKGTRAPCNCLARMSEVNAAGRVFRVQGSSFQEKMCLGSPKKRTALKKRLFIAIKKKARAIARNCTKCTTAPCVLGSIQHLPVLTTALKRARETCSVTVANANVLTTKRVIYCKLAGTMICV
jgi:hypothetical protein